MIMDVALSLHHTLDSQHRVQGRRHPSHPSQSPSRVSYTRVAQWMPNKERGCCRVRNRPPRSISRGAHPIILILSRPSIMSLFYSITTHPQYSNTTPTLYPTLPSPALDDHLHIRLILPSTAYTTLFQFSLPPPRPSRISQPLIPYCKNIKQHLIPVFDHRSLPKTLSQTTPLTPYLFFLTLHLPSKHDSPRS